MNNGLDRGANLAFTVGRLGEVGCSSLALAPYQEWDYITWPTEAAWVDALSRRTLGAYALAADTPEGLEALKQRLANGRLAVVRFDVYSTFEDRYPAPAPGISNGVYYCPDGARIAGHAVTVVGYDDARSYVDHRDGSTRYGAFLLANSWGDSWGVTNSTGTGTKGFLWVAYAAFQEGSFGPYAYFTDDRPGYRPRVYAVAGVNHPTRRSLRVLSGVGAPGFPQALSYAAIDGSGGAAAISDARRIAVDLTDLLHSVPPDGVANLFVEVRVAGAASDSATVTSASFYADLEGDGTYTELPSADPTLSITPGSLGWACAAASGGAVRFVDARNAAGPWEGTTPNPYQTIQAAVDASAAGDLVVLMPGAYPEEVMLSRSLHLLGAGLDRSVVAAPDGGAAISVGGGAEVSIRSLTVEGGAVGVRVEGGSADLVRAKVRSCETGLSILGPGDRLSVRETTVAGCGVGLEARAGTTTVDRATFHRNAEGMVLAAAATVQNTIVAEGGGAGIRAAGGAAPTIRFCNVWGNGQDYADCAPGPGCLSEDPMLFAPFEGYHNLGYGSPCANAGAADGVNADGETDIGAHAAVTVAPEGADYDDIALAVEAAARLGPRASVLVGPGVYQIPDGRIRLFAPVAVIGASPTHVVVDGARGPGNGFCVHDGAGGGAISGFTVANHGFNGVALYLESRDGAPVPFLISHNIIRHSFRSGVHIHGDSSPRIASNTIVANGDDGVRLAADSTSRCQPVIENNIIADNLQAGIVQLSPSAAPVVDYNDIYNSPTLAYGITLGQHNLHASPLFVNPAGHDYHLSELSPCIDAGNPASEYRREPEPNGGRINLGAYGNTSEAQLSPLFRDVPRGHWAYDYIAACHDAGIVGGYGDGTYRPELAVSRDQMAVFISRALAGGDASVPPGPAEATFPDVPVEHWAFRHIEYAGAQGIVAGYEDGLYRPEGLVDRGQMAVFVARGMAGADGQVPEPEGEPTFADVTAEGEWGWCHRYVEYIAATAVTGGYPDGLYHPEYVVGRDQMAVFVARGFGLPME